MNAATFRSLTLLGALALSLMATGCAKKATTTPPETAPTPPTTTTPTPTPTPTPEPPAPAPPAPSATELVSRMSPVFFDYDASSLSDAARAALDGNARLLRDNPTLNVVIEGHCDERGTSEYNQALGERRAQSARDYLTAAGIAAARMQIISYGKERPFATGSDEASYAQNRRAHFTAR